MQRMPATSRIAPRACSRWDMYCSGSSERVLQHERRGPKRDAIQRRNRGEFGPLARGWVGRGCEEDGVRKPWRLRNAVSSESGDRRRWCCQNMACRRWCSHRRWSARTVVCSESRARPGVVCSGIMATVLLRVLHHPCQSLSSRMGGSNLLSLAHTNRPEVMHSHSTLSCPDRPQRSLTTQTLQLSRCQILL